MWKRRHDPRRCDVANRVDALITEWIKVQQSGFNPKLVNVLLEASEERVYLRRSPARANAFFYFF